MGKVLTLRDTRPSGWSKDRWDWMQLVIADGTLTPLARLVAVVLAQGFANHETAECTPGVAKLMKRVDSSRASVMRALAALQAAGWLVRKGGEAPYRAASYGFRYPEPVATARPERVATLGSNGLTHAKSPCTPYKDQPEMNQEDVPNPLSKYQRPDIAVKLVAPGSTAAVRWDEFLASEGYQLLAEIGIEYDGHYVMPMTVPADKFDTVPRDIALRWANWLRSRAVG